MNPCEQATVHDAGHVATHGQQSYVFLDNKIISDSVKTNASLFSEFLPSLRIHVFIPASYERPTSPGPVRR